MLSALRILLVEDNDSDADLLHRELKKSGLNFCTQTVQTREAFEAALQNFKPDIILSDYALPSFDAVTAFRIKQNKFPLIPFIIVSGVIGEENAVELIKNGVTDYASKNKLFGLSTKINRALNDAKSGREKRLNEESLRIQQQELQLANEALVRQDEKINLVNQELLQLNQELEERVAKRTRALAESESRFRNMMETIPQIAWTNTVEGKVVFYNQRWYDYTGLDVEQSKTTGIATVIHPDDLKDSIDQFKSIRKTNEGGEFQIRGKRVDGIYRWHLIRLMPIKNEINQVQHWVGTATDIQELRILQQQKDDFISIASHELKTPITSLKAALQLLDRIKDKPQSSMLPSLITQANKSLRKVNTLIEDLLNASLANEGQLHIMQEMIVLSDILQESFQEINSVGNYEVKIEGDLGLSVYADPIRIEQVVINFVNNAMKYASEAHVILIYIERIAEVVKVSVVDRGPGIPPEKIRYIFDRYYRANSNVSLHNGLGLGLYICADIIKKHQGEIGVDSVIGKGSTFWFTLPIV